MNQTTKTVAQLARGRALLFGLDLPDAIESSLDTMAEGISLLDAEVLRGSSSATLAGFGPLEPLMLDDAVEEIWINRPDEIWFADSQGSHRLSAELSGQQLETIVARMLRSTSRRLDRSNPFVDATLPDGSRLHVVIPNVTRENWSVNVRKFRVKQVSLEGLVKAGSIAPDQADHLRKLLQEGGSVIISGATQAGKTTLLTAMLNELSSKERLVTVEDTFEINCQVGDWVALQTRDSLVDGATSVDLRRLVRETLRMRPTRIAVGEVRGAEALEMLLAFNSGIPGICTIHANSAHHAIQKLKTLPLLAGAGMSAELVKELVQQNISAVVHCERSNGVRRVSQIVTLNE